MICKDAYLATANKFFYLAEEFVEQIWLAAEQAMQKKSIQKPALESKHPEQCFKFVGPGMDDFFASQFTQAELQFLKTIIKEEIKYVQDDKNVAKADAAYLYDLCDKDNNFRFFALMNKARTETRKQSAKLAKLETLQWKIKKQLNIG